MENITKKKKEKFSLPTLDIKLFIPRSTRNYFGDHWFKQQMKNK